MVRAKKILGYGRGKKKGGGGSPTIATVTNPAKLGKKAVVVRRSGRFVAGRRRSSGGRGGFTNRRVSVPVAKTNIRNNRGPNINGRESTVVCHSEYLQEVTGSTTFANAEYAVNPGLPASFPWLSSIANQYEEYRFRRLAYRFETEAPTSTKGCVILVTDYDALDSAFTAKQQAMDYRGATRTAPWTPVVHRLGGKEMSPYKNRYVRATAVPEGGDQKTYDVGNFQLITTGMADTAVVGELYVEYEVELIGPKVNNILGANLLGIDVRAGGTINTANPMGTAPSVIPGSNINIAFNGGSTSVGQSGRFLIVFTSVGTTISAQSITPAGGASTVTNYGTVINAAATSAITVMSVDLIANQGQGFTLAVTNATLTAGTLVMSQLSSALTAVKRPKAPKGLPLYVPEDPTAARLAKLEALLASLGIEERPVVRPSTTLTGF